MNARRNTLFGFRSRRPKYRVEQSQSLVWLAKAHARAEQTLRPNCGADFGERMWRVIERVGCAPSQIASRGSELADFTHTDWSNMEIYSLAEQPQGKGMLARTRRFERLAQDYFDTTYEPDARAPDDLIHVTCTGYVSPSAAQTLVQRRGWGARTRVTHAYHMGCYAAFPALRIASGFCAADRSVDIVHTELCTMHLDPSQHTPEQLVVQSLFADGYIRYSMQANCNKPGLAILALDEAILPDSSGSMSWICSGWGMQMTLARDVPERIGAALDGFVRRLFASAGHDLHACADVVFAVHPGGPKIIDRVCDTLRLAPHQVSHSRQVLREHGNMSSATLPHVWMNIVADPNVAPGTLIASLAFGPGLTVCGGLMVKT